MPKIGLCTVFLSVLSVFMPVFDAAGGVELVSPDAQLVIADDVLPQAIDRGEWSLLVWVHAPEAILEESTLLSIGGHLAVLARPDGLVIETRQAGYSASLFVDAPLQTGRWHLLAFSMDFRGRRADAWLATQGEGGDPGPIEHAWGTLVRLGRRASQDHALATHVPALPEPPSSGLIVGAFRSDLPAAGVVYEALTIRDHALLDDDVRTVWLGRRYYDPHGLDTTGSGGRMNGWRGCVFFTFHATSAEPNGPGAAEEKASFVGGPVSADNLMMIREPVERVAARVGLFRLVGPVVSALGMVYRSRLEPEFDGFFEIEPVPFVAPIEPIGPVGDRTSMLATGPRGLIRVIVSANSRGVRGTNPPQPWPEGFSHGFVQALYAQTAGVMMRPATLLDSRGGWFGIDTSESSPRTTLVRPLHTRTGALGDWTRFGSGTLPAASVAPGPATNVSPSGVYRLRCRPMPGSLLVADAPLVYRSTLLAFPGSSDLIWEPERGLLQDGPGLLVGDRVTVPLDTTRQSHVLTDEDVFLSGTELSLPMALDVREGEALVVFSGAARIAVSVAESVREEGGRTMVTLSHPFGAQPGVGAELRIGPWRFHDVEHRFNPVPAGDERTWRGLVLHAADDDRLGLMVYAASAWRPDVDGFVFGAAGQSGQGYAIQLRETFPGSLEAWAAQADPDVWIQALAQQRSSPTSMSDYLHRLRAGLPADAEVVWATSAVHGRVTHESWHRYVQNNAADEGVAAVFAVGDPRVGSYYAQAASGMRTDDAHFSSFGSRVIAQVWLDQLAILADDPCRIADYDRDGDIDVFDLLEFQSDWEAQDPRADLDGDGRFVLFDFLVLLTAINDCA